MSLYNDDANRRLLGAYAGAAKNKEKAALVRAFDARVEARWRSKVRPGEEYVREWCCDCAECDCPPRGKKSSIPWLSIATGTTPEGIAYQRCLNCNTAWTAREYRWQPARKIKLRRAS